MPHKTLLPNYPPVARIAVHVTAMWYLNMLQPLLDARESDHSNGPFFGNLTGRLADPTLLSEPGFMSFLLAAGIEAYYRDPVGTMRAVTQCSLTLLADSTPGLGDSELEQFDD